MAQQASQKKIKVINFKDKKNQIKKEEGGKEIMIKPL